MNDTSENSKIAWAAGFFEGEGCISFRNTTSVSLLVGSTDLDALERLQDILGGNITGPYRKTKSTKDSWEWGLHKASDVELALLLLIPWLCERRQLKAQQALERLRTPKTVRIPNPKEIKHGTRSGYYQEKKMNIDRCPDCLRAYNEYIRNWRKNRPVGTI